MQRVHLDIQVGEHAVDYKQIATKDKLSDLQLRVRQLLDQVEQITKEQNFQRVRLKSFLSCDYGYVVSVFLKFFIIITMKTFACLTVKEFVVK